LKLVAAPVVVSVVSVTATVVSGDSATVVVVASVALPHDASTIAATVQYAPDLCFTIHRLRLPSIFLPPSC
jgi:hypothetical protein